MTIYRPARLLLTFGTLLMAGHCLRAQAILTASKGADIFVFGGYTYTAPDYGPGHDNGITLGGDYTRYFGWPIQPSIELRYTNSSGPIVKESTISGGFRGHINLGTTRYHPYADVLIGRGTITYVQPPIPNYPPDHGLAISYGGGIDIDLLRNFLFKADFQLQNWNLGENAVIVPSGGNYTLSPMATTIGISYRIPFHSFVGSRYSRVDQLPKDRPAPPPKSGPPAPPPAADQPTPPPANSSAASPAPSTPPAPVDQTVPSTSSPSTPNP